MNINRHPTDVEGVVRLAVAGELDMATTDELDKVISDEATSLDTTRIIVDLANVSFCDSPPASPC